MSSSTRSSQLSLASVRRRPDEFASATRRLVRDVLDPVAASTDASGEIPPEIKAQLSELGYFGLTIPPEYGGVGLSLTEYLSVVVELTKTNLAFQELVEENNGIGSASVLSAGTEEQRQRWLPELATGRAMGAFALTEPGAGSDAAAIRTTAHQVSGGFILDGRKHFITHGADADLITVVARIATTDPSAPSFGMFIVTPGTPGFSVARVQPMMGFRATRHAELVLDEAFVPDDDVVGAPGEGLVIAKQTLDRGRLTVAADCLGQSQMLLDRMVWHAMSRQTFGRRLADRGQVREMIARSAADLFFVESAMYSCARRVELGSEAHRLTAAVKVFASEAAGRIADRAIQIHGGIGYTVDAQLERAARDLRVMRIAEGPTEVLLASLARSAIRDAKSEAVMP